MNAPSLLGLLGGFLLLGLVFGAIERLFRARPGPSWWRRPGATTDVLWLGFSAFVTRFVRFIVVTVLVLGVVVVAGGSVDAFRAETAAGRFPDLSLFGLGATVRALPFAAQLLLGLFVADGIGYLVHRALHGRRLWRFHAVHHSSERLDWLASVRVHPVNALLGDAARAAPLLWLGFDPTVFAVVTPFLTFYGLLLHANVDWSFGPLRFVLASPRFHRWHHTAEAEGIDRNFAGLFPVYDLVFGTWYMPDHAPTRFGAPNDRVPTGFLGQLAHPFRAGA